MSEWIRDAGGGIVGIETAGEQTQREPRFRKELESLLNSNCRENGSNTPDFILANYLILCLDAFDATVNWREKWYSRPEAHLPVPEKTP